MQSNTKTVTSAKNQKDGFRKGKKHIPIPKIPFVRAMAGENPENLVGRFIKAVERSGILEEVEDRMFYVKPSVKRRKRMNDWKRRIKDAEAQKRARDIYN